MQARPALKKEKSRMSASKPLPSLSASSHGRVHPHFGPQVGGWLPGGRQSVVIRGGERKSTRWRGRRRGERGRPSTSTCPVLKPSLFQSQPILCQKCAALVIYRASPGRAFIHSFEGFHDVTRYVIRLAYPLLEPLAEN